ncbi:hypothetical protein L3X38_021817 [Prunus dulcis]|uniref:TF-B3 domain-containing protein n=1 Tax=Prunus dulcis TaxID=3755 RepID=A0AAD4VVR7_PRUDU|nr:hypothetical protein L3X38_021817 [Prunus dulcis]
MVRRSMSNQWGSQLHPVCSAKILTASDTSGHGGFSVLPRAAEDCFPPLDYNQQRPSQELIAKDLHGLEWRFRHIYIGVCKKPQRHFLTTGWSAFVNKKKLISGDAVLFLRDMNPSVQETWDALIHDSHTMFIQLFVASN